MKRWMRWLQWSCIIVVTVLAVMGDNGYTAHAQLQQSKINLSYIYFGTPNQYINMVDKTNGALTHVSPDFFNINSDGTLALTAKVNRNFVEEMHKRGIKVVPFLSNHWSRALGQAALNNREVLAEQIAQTVKDYGLDGVNIDIENMTQVERSMYTDLVRLLSEKLPGDAELSVAVAANPYGFNNGWQGSYDYAGLAVYSDYLMIMAYDEHYESGPEGPVASSRFVEASIQYALQRVPKEKIVLGLPFFGRYWKSGASYGGYGVNQSTSEALIQRLDGKVTFDTRAASPKAVLTVKPEHGEVYAGSRKLEPGTYTLWYENEASLKNKLRLVQKYDLAGAANWSLGQESPSVWSYISLWLNGQYFSDIEGNWAERDILMVSEKGWMKGTSPYRFSPAEVLTRAQAATLLVRTLQLQDQGQEIHFDDIENHWASKEISIIAQHGLMIGTAPGRFSPDAPVERAQMAVLLDRVVQRQGGTPEAWGKPFADVNAVELPWAYTAIMNMASQGIYTGLPDGTFRPRTPVSREQGAALMNRMAVYFD